MLNNNHLTIASHPADYELRFLEEQIILFNLSQTQIDNDKQLAIFIRDKQSEIIAGISAWTWGDTCEINYFWVREDMRGRGYGKRLLSAVESESQRRGCNQIILTTYSFQSPEFYRHFGYEAVCILDNCPHTHKRYTFRKVMHTNGRTQN